MISGTTWRFIEEEQESDKADTITISYNITSTTLYLCPLAFLRINSSGFTKAKWLQKQAHIKSPLTITNISRYTHFLPPKRKKLCTTKDTKRRALGAALTARHPNQQATLSSQQCNGLKEDTRQCWIRVFLHSSTVLYAMIKSCILSINILALTAGLESKSFCLAAVHHSPISGFANHRNNSCFVKKHFLIFVNSNKDVANPQSHGKQEGHNHFRGTFYTSVLSGSNALPKSASIGTLTV